MLKMAFPAIKGSEWPALDLQLWNLAKQPVELFEDGGAAADWSKAYVANVELFYGQYLRFLLGAGGLDPACTPIERVTKQNIRAFMDAFGPGRAETTVAAVVAGIAALVRVCHPPDGAPWLAVLARRLAKTAKPHRPKQPRTASIEELLWLAERLIAEGRSMLSEGKRAGAPIYRDGLIIATWVAHSIRRSNMADLRLGETFFVEGNQIHVHIEPNETKNGVELDRDYPEWLVTHFLEYIANIRPVLLEASSEPDQGWLWIGRCGKKLQAQSLRVITTNRTQRLLDRSVPPQNFRHSTVTDIARLRPDLIYIAKDVLGHRSGVTTDKYYILADSFRAFAAHDAMIERRREGK